MIRSRAASPKQLKNKSTWNIVPRATMPASFTHLLFMRMAPVFRCVFIHDLARGRSRVKNVAVGLADQIPVVLLVENQRKEHVFHEALQATGSKHRHTGRQQKRVSNLPLVHSAFLH